MKQPTNDDINCSQKTVTVETPWKDIDQWQGQQDGLPPDGLECEVDHPRDNVFVRCVILGRKRLPKDGEPEAVYEVIADDPDWIGMLDSAPAMDFRPKRSDKQREVDAIIQGMSFALDEADFTVQMAAESLYDNGVRMPDPTQKPITRVDAHSKIVAELLPNRIGINSLNKVLDALGYKE